MKIRRILATAVAAAVTTPLVFLSAGPALADTPSVPFQVPGGQAAAGAEDPDGDDFAEYERLLAAVAAAEKKVEKLKAERQALMEDLAADRLDPAVKAEYAAAQLAATEAGRAKTTADADLLAAENKLREVTADPNATEQAKADAAKAVEEAKKKVAEAVTAKATADERLARATKARDDARVELARKIEALKTQVKEAEQELAAAEAALAEFEEGDGGSCAEDTAVTVSLSGPKAIHAGDSGVFALTVKNTSPGDLDAVRAFAFATALPNSWEDLDDEELGGLDRFLKVEWSSAAQPKWTPVDAEEDEAIELGALAKGGKADLKLRLTVDEETPESRGVAFAVGAWENEDGSCGVGREYSDTFFDILAPKKDEKPSPTPTPSPSTATPTPAPTTGGNGTTTQQGGSSSTPVNGTLAATGANDVLPGLGLAAGAAVALGAGALVVARRRKADA